MINNHAALSNVSSVSTGVLYPSSWPTESRSRFDKVEDRTRMLTLWKLLGLCEEWIFPWNVKLCEARQGISRIPQLLQSLGS